LNSSVIISPTRTAIVSDREISLGAGGAIVALSDPEEEYDEMLLKANSIMTATGLYLRDMEARSKMKPQ
jgi:anthranilate/para-aminobenzoate synthase component I